MLELRWNSYKIGWKWKLKQTKKVPKILEIK